MTRGRSHTVLYRRTSVRSMDLEDKSQRGLHKEVEGKINRILSWRPSASVMERRMLSPLAWDAASLHFELVIVALIHRR